jgi:hypothetical protein
MYSWQQDYIALLSETDPLKQRHRLYEAVSAIEQRRLSPIEPNSEEYDALERAQKAIDIIKRNLED